MAHSWSQRPGNAGHVQPTGGVGDEDDVAAEGGANVVAEAAIFTEGERAKWAKVAKVANIKGE